MGLPLTYPDLACLDDLDPFASETTSDLQSLSQDVLHLLKELPGSNPDDPDRGLGVEQYLSGTETAFRGLPSKIDAQLGDDPRVTGSHTELVRVADGSFTIGIQIHVGNDVVPLSYGVSAAGGVVQL